MEKELLIQIGNRLREKRLELQMTQEQMAERLMMSINFYGCIERGVKKLSIEKILLAYQEFDLDPTYLLTGNCLSPSNFQDLLSQCPKDKLYNLERIIFYYIESVK